MYSNDFFLVLLDFTCDYVKFDCAICVWLDAQQVEVLFRHMLKAFDV